MKALRKSSASILTIVLGATLALSGCTKDKEATPSSSPAASTNSTASASPTQSPAPAETTGGKLGLDPASLTDLNISVLGNLQTGNKNPTEDALTPIWRANTKVIPKIVEKPKNIESFTQYLQLQEVADTVPDILAPASGVFNNPEVYNYLKKQGTLREITLDDIKKYMPRTAARYAEYGVTLDDWYNANVDPGDGKLWYIPGNFSVGFNPELRDSSVFAENFSISPMTYYFRDDILKKIYPDAKTEAELRQLYVDKGGKLTIEDLTADVPIKNYEDLTNYLKKVKELGTKQGDKTIIPSHIQFSNTADALWWANFNLTGFWWEDGLNDRITSPTSLEYVFGTPEWKTFTKFMNGLYNEGLSDKEVFIQKEDQKNQKVINGEYAVFHPWLPVNDAREKAKTENRGYGFRAIPLFMSSFKNDHQDYSRRVLTLVNNQGAVGITKSITDEQIPQILNWIDWNLGEEAGTLRKWGPPEFSTGEGADRRFKPEYKELEAWAVSGAKSEKDGTYYGMYNNETEHDSAWNQETNGIGNYLTVVDSPARVYVQDKDSINIDNVISAVIRTNGLSQSTLWEQLPLGQDAKDAKAAFDKIVEEYGKITKVASFQADGAKNANVKAIIDKPDNFDKNYAAIEKFNTPELLANIKLQNEAWINYQNVLQKYLKPLK
ncbi:hypothetical protein EHS13_23230 [Paenibacillus psychroresistens]|uniref:Extracellular solute-binding protein n=1 Tax=Paenibacillus psychroresistens TaxID=1778678 RepID=A0A6B8RPH7_9BACL|nr:hypothetical protein [Paenibacillus psychroresistens]QGQ97592.1 hypothetical protein EHS13_23230 [Paenibacillus psychroresistens]